MLFQERYECCACLVVKLIVTLVGGEKIPSAATLCFLHP